MINESIRKGLEGYCLIPSVDTKIKAANANWPYFLKNCVPFFDDGTLAQWPMSREIKVLAHTIETPKVKPVMRGTSTTCWSFTMISCFDRRWAPNQKALARAIIRAATKVEWLLLSHGKNYETRLSEAAKFYNRILIKKSVNLTGLPNDFGGSPGDLLRLSNKHIASDEAIVALERLAKAALDKKGGYGRKSNGRIEAFGFSLEVGPSGVLLEATDCVRTETGAMRPLPASSRSEDRSASKKCIPSERAYQRMAIEANRNARGRINSIKRAAQVLPIGHGLASCVDVGRLLAILSDEESIDDEVTSSAKIALLLSFFSGRPLSQIVRAKLVEDECAISRKAKPVIAVPVHSAYLFVPTYSAEGARRVDKSWSAFVRPTEKYIALPMSNVLRNSVLRYLRIWNRKPGGALIGLPLSLLERAASELLRGDALPPRHTLTQKRIESFLPSQLSSALGGRNIASFVLGIPVGGTVDSQLYYISQRREWVAEKYQDAVSSVLKNIGVSPEFDDRPLGYPIGWVGSQVRSEVEVFRALGADMRSKINERYSQRHHEDYYRDSHDLITLYVLTAFQLLTGFRPFSSPIASFSDIDPVTGFALIGDKIIDISHEKRLVWLPPTFLHFLEVYKRRRKAVLVQAPEKGSVGPFFFYRSGDKPGAATQGGIQELSTQFWSMPINAPRHFLVNYLIERSVPSHVIDALMGHWSMGEEPYSAPSVLSPGQLKSALERPITNLWSDLQWHIPKAMLR